MDNFRLLPIAVVGLFGDTQVMRPVLLFLLIVAACDGERSPVPSNESIDQLIARLEAHPRPTGRLIDAIEHQLAAVPCIGDLGGWERRYAYALPSPEIDENTIDFMLREKGRFGILSGREVTAPGAFKGIDDTPVYMVWGSFDRTTQKIHIEFCGKNAPG